jgi:hypothetical protein
VWGSETPISCWDRAERRSFFLLRRAEAFDDSLIKWLFSDIVANQDSNALVSFVAVQSCK